MQLDPTYKCGAKNSQPVYPALSPPLLSSYLSIVCAIGPVQFLAHQSTSALHGSLLRAS